MLEGMRARLSALGGRLRRLERRELDAILRWLERTGNLLHLSVLVLVPLLIGAVTWIANVSAAVSFLLFPPLASGTYTLFADPEGRYSKPGKFVGGMTAGACCGWLALAITAGTGLNGGEISTSGAALGIFFTGAVTWALDLEEPTAFSTALLVLVTGNAQLAYVVGIVVSSSFVAAVFIVWRDRIYEQRAQYLYGTTTGDDHVLVPMSATGGRGASGDATSPETVARFAAELASAHEAGKIVLFDIVDGDIDGTDRGSGGDAESELEADAESELEADAESELGANSESELGAGPGTETGTEPPHDQHGPARARRTVATLESLADDLEERYDVPCEVVVASSPRRSPPAKLVLQTARRHACDLIVTPYAEHERGGLSSFIRGLFDSEIDVIAFRSSDGRRRWSRPLVPVRGAGDTARGMVDFALRLGGRYHPVSVCTCIDRESHRRRAEGTLADLVDAFDGRFETHVVTESVERYLERVAPQYDVVFVGSSTDRSTASRFVSPPTFERLSDLEADVAIVHRGRRR